LAQFWDTHDLTDFEDELDEVTKPIFEGDDDSSESQSEAEAVRRIAES
jgi:hypothetical protein